MNEFMNQLGRHDNQDIKSRSDDIIGSVPLLKRDWTNTCPVEFRFVYPDKFQKTIYQGRTLSGIQQDKSVFLCVLRISSEPGGG